MYRNILHNREVLLVNMEEYIRSIKTENEYFFRTLSGFECCHIRQGNLPFDLTPKILENVQSGNEWLSFLKLGTMSQRYRRLMRVTWVKDGPQEYSLSTMNHGCLGNPCAGNTTFVKMPQTCWADLWKNITGESNDISFILNTCNKYNIKILYPTRQYESNSNYDGRGHYTKTVFTEYYVLLIEAKGAASHRDFLRRKKLFEYSKAFYDKMSCSEIVKNITATMRKTQCYSADYNIEISHKYYFTVYEDRIEYGSGYKTENWSFYENGLKDLPSIECRIGLSYAIAEDLLKDVEDTVDVKTSTMLEIALDNLTNFRFTIKDKVYPKPLEPTKDISNLKDWL